MSVSPPRDACSSRAPSRRWPSRVRGRRRDRADQMCYPFGSVPGGCTHRIPSEFHGDMYYSIDVECVATGTDHNSRSVAQISLVNQYEQVILNMYVKQEKAVASYLTPLTGLTKEILDVHGIPLQQALEILKAALPKNAILVGQNISKDVEWLQLRAGEDYQELMDLTGLYRIYNPKYKSFSIYSQDHLAKVLLGWQLGGTHDAVGDAIKSIRLFNFYQTYHQDPQAWNKVSEQLIHAPPTESFAKLNPSFEGVCMGHRKTCTCGAPFFG